ncbi:MAG: aminopeptidase P family protein [Sphingomonadales bacterium]|nr:aminopeptidase P family protein [Sphingomonadales bacterium]
MKYGPANAQLFVNNRRRFAERMQPGCIAVFSTNDSFPRNADDDYAFRPNSELYWLTGIDQEDTHLILFPDCPVDELREVLFIRETSEDLTIWEGPKHSKERARELSGITVIRWSSVFDAQLHPLMTYAKGCYLNTNENDRLGNFLPDSSLRLASKLQNRYPLHNYHRAAPLFAQLRARKQPEEIDMLRKAVKITGDAFTELLPKIKPGMWEFEIEAELIRSILKDRAQGFSFSPIIAAGASACILHYTHNDRICNEGDLILMDFGADYGHYAGDMTRCVPASGRFSGRQKQLYDAVLRVQAAATRLLVVGRTLDEYNRESALIMQEELLSLGLITRDDVNRAPTDSPAYKKYFPHGTGHFLGIDVHDIGERHGKLDEGMVITCEPGIYIGEEGIGIRIENDILITASGPMNLMEGIPIETEEIEEWMNS